MRGQPVGTRRHPRVTSLFRSSLPTRRPPHTKNFLVTNIKWNDGYTQKCAIANIRQTCSFLSQFRGIAEVVKEFMEYIADSPLLAHNCKFDIMARARRFERRRLRASRTFPGSQARNARVTRTVACCFESWILTERSSCFNRTFSSLRCCFSSLVSSNVETALLWRPCNSLCFTTYFCLCSSTFSRPIFRAINFAWTSNLATTLVLVSSSFNLDSKKSRIILVF